MIAEWWAPLLVIPGIGIALLYGPRHGRASESWPRDVLFFHSFEAVLIAVGVAIGFLAQS